MTGRDGSDGQHAGLRDAVLVGLGGMIGTCARYLLDRLVPASPDFPWSTLLVNLSGAFLIGVVAGWFLGEHHQRWRLLFGTGVLGGYTTYSLLAADMAEMLLDDRLVAALAYGVGTLAAGVLLTVAGLFAASAVRRIG